MLLRYKKRDTDDEKFNYTIYSEFYPPMSSAASELRSSIQIPAGTKPTPVIPQDIALKASASFFMTGMVTECTEDNFKPLFNEFINPEDRNAITDIKLDKTDVAIIFCKSWEDCARIVKSKENVQFHGDNVSFMLFSENKPSSN